MLTTKQIISILEEFDGNEKNFISIFNRVAKTGLQIQQNSEELLEECQRIFKNHDSAFQFMIKDVNFSFFLKVVDGIMTYGRGVYQEEDIPLVVIKFPLDVILPIVRQEISPESLYCKGIITLKGSISNAMRLRTLGYYYMKYIEEIFNI
jgi:hypothetical protein